MSLQGQSFCQDFNSWPLVHEFNPLTTAPGGFLVTLEIIFTGCKQRDDLEICELVSVDLHLGAGPHELLHLADRRRHLPHALGRKFLLRDGGLQVADKRGQNALEVHGRGALSHAEDEDVGPGVADEGNLCLVAAINSFNS